MYDVILKPGRERSVIQRHPWLFSGAIDQISGTPETGETVQVLDSKGNFLAYGAYSPKSQIRIRIWTQDQKEVIDKEFFRSRLQAAISFRKATLLKDIDIKSPAIATRLVYAESDNLPGLIVDLYCDVLVVQVLSSGIERWRDIIADLLLELTGFSHIYERSDVEVRKLEGLKERKGPLRGNPPESIEIEENGLRYIVSISKGHKTGFYLDQRVNRSIIQHNANGKDVLDCFTYTGGFAINALKGGAGSIMAIDTSSDSLNSARENLRINHFPSNKILWVEEDVFHHLRKLRDQGVQFDLIILDPPKFAPTSSQVQKASRGYKDINLWAFKLLRSGGLLVTFSCSGGMNPQLFQKIVADAALDASVDAKIIQYLSQSPDHPTGLNFPEGAYLKGLLIKVDK